MSGRVIKVVIFVLVMIMLASVVTALLDPGLGKPDESRRTRHPAGFSVSYPLGWGGTAFSGPNPETGGYIRLAQERKTGRETTITVEFLGNRAQPMSGATEGTFQGQPAFYSTKRAGTVWQWRVQFQREERWFMVLLTTPIPLDVEKSPYWPYIESFRIEKRIEPLAPATLPAILPAQ